MTLVTRRSLADTCRCSERFMQLRMCRRSLGTGKCAANEAWQVAHGAGEPRESACGCGKHQNRACKGPAAHPDPALLRVLVAFVAPRVAHLICPCQGASTPCSWYSLGAQTGRPTQVYRCSTPPQACRSEPQAEGTGSSHSAAQATRAYISRHFGCFCLESSKPPRPPEPSTLCVSKEQPTQRQPTGARSVTFSSHSSQGAGL